MIVDNLPPWLLYTLPEFSLLLIGVLVERYYVSRVTCFTNSIALTIHVISLGNPGALLVWFTDLGFIIGVYGLLSYIFSTKTHFGYNLFAYFLYSSTTVGLVLFLPGVSFLPAAGLGVLLQLGLAYLLGDDAELVYSGPRPGPVADFIKYETAQFTDQFGVTHKVDLDLIFSR